MSTTLLPPRRSTDAKKIACEIHEQHRLSNVAKAELLELIAHFDEHELFEALGASSTVNWLQRELRYPVSTAYEYVRVGRKLQDFPHAGGTRLGIQVQGRQPVHLAQPRSSRTDR